MSWLWLAFALLLVVALALGAAWLVWRRRIAPPALSKRRALRPRTTPQHAVVLAHGLFGFDELSLGDKRVEYWRGIPRALRKMGVEVAVPRFGTIASVESRAAQLAEVIRTMPGKKVNVIGHSMGGVDARVAIARFGAGERVASLTTIASPHRGTPLADLSPFFRDRPRTRVKKSSDDSAVRSARKPKAVRGTFGALMERGQKSLAMHTGGLRDVRPAAMQRLNRRIRDDERVHYASVLSAVDGVAGVNPLLVPGYLFLSGKAGRNDGVVPEQSQAWGDILARVEADHWAVVGWSKNFDAPDFYESILRELASRGF